MCVCPYVPYFKFLAYSNEFYPPISKRIPRKPPTPRLGLTNNWCYRNMLTIFQHFSTFFQHFLSLSENKSEPR